MPCPDELEVAAIVGGDAAIDARSWFVDHIDDCTACRRLVAGLIRSDDPRGEPSRDWRPGQRVGRYILGERIGRGRMGAVYRAEDPELGRAVALKRLHADGDARSRAQLVREARSAAQLQHPNVVAVYEVVDDDHAPALAMELVDGVTLTAWLRERPRRWRDIVAVVAQAGRGLAAAHARGLIHRDFKPDNILVDREGRARVADFGLANVDDALGSAATTGGKLARLTAIGAGTPAYMAPELVNGDRPDVRSDVYAFAVTLWEALHGKHPFAGATIEAVWAEMAIGRIRDGKRGVPTWLERRVRRGLAVDPADRWPDLEGFVQAIDRRPHRLAVAGGAALAGFAAAAALAFGLSPASDPGDDCAAGAALVDSVWNPDRKLAIGGRFVRAAPGRAVRAIATASQVLDDWSGAWRLARRSACSATTDRPARLACLDRQLDELGAQLAVWTHADPEVVDRAVAAATRLPSPSECARATTVPDAAGSLAARIAETRVLWRSGRAAQAAPLLAPLLRDAEAAGHHATLAAALLSASVIEQDTNAVAEATAHATRSATEASKAGDDALLYAAWIQQAHLWIEAGRPLDALGLCDAAEALAARGLPNPERASIARGGALMRTGRAPEAIAQYERAIAILEPAARHDPAVRLQLAIAIAGLGNAYILGRKPEPAIEQHLRALALQEAGLGPGHPEVARTLKDLAQAEASLRRFGDAEPHARRARQIFVAAYGEAHPEVGEADIALATFAARQGRTDEARRILHDAGGALARALRPDHPIFEVIEGQLGALEQDDDKCDAAIPHYRKAAEILIANHVGGDELARVHVNLAACAIDRGRVADAQANAERALDELAAAGVPDRERAVPWMVLALAADARRDRAGAIELARKVIAVTTDDDPPPRADARKLMRDKLRAWTR